MGRRRSAPGLSTVKVVDLASKSIEASTRTKGNHRANELAYDPVDKIILVAHDADVPFPFVTFISAETRTVLGKIVYNGFNGNPLSTGGPDMSVPATAVNPNGEVGDNED